MPDAAACAGAGPDQAGGDCTLLRTGIDNDLKLYYILILVKKEN